MQPLERGPHHGDLWHHHGAPHHGDFTAVLAGLIMRTYTTIMVGPHHGGLNPCPVWHLVQASAHHARGGWAGDHVPDALPMAPPHTEPPKRAPIMGDFTLWWPPSWRTSPSWRPHHGDFGPLRGRRGNATTMVGPRPEGLEPSYILVDVEDQDIDKITQ